MVSGHGRSQPSLILGKPSLNFIITNPFSATSKTNQDAKVEDTSGCGVEIREASVSLT